MLCLSTGWRFLSRAHPLACPPHLAALSVTMYTTRLYGAAGGGGGGGGGAKSGRRMGLTVLDVAPPPHPHLPHHPHPGPPAPTYQLYPGRPDAHRGPHFHHHHHYHLQPAHLALPPPAPHPHYQPHAHFHTYGGAAATEGGKKKKWHFINEKMSYDTFFTMKRLIERSRRPDEVLRWVTQNPGKISHNHYPLALQKIVQLLQTAPPYRPSADGDTPVPSRGGEEGDVLEHQDFHTLCSVIVSDCSKFDNFSIVNCLYAVAALGLPSDSEVVQVLEAESQSRLSQFNQKDLSMVFSSSRKLHPGSQHPLTEACLAGLEENMERERHPQTLFLLLSYYRLKWRLLQPQDAAAGGAAVPAAAHTSDPEQLLVNRKILRLVKHTLASVSGIREQEMALLDEMLAACAHEASDKTLELIFSSHLFYHSRQERFISSLAEELPQRVDSITPYTMALISKYIARHRLRETQLLDTIAQFLVKKAEYLDTKVIQKLVFPFSRMSYRPTNQQEFFSRLEEVVELKALSSPLATVNILMSLFQLGHFPSLVLHRVFSSAFISNVTNSQCSVIARRYLSLLDSAVELEYHEYSGPRLPDAHKVLIITPQHAQTTDEVNRKYSYKGLVAEALRQLVGEQSYKQDQVLAPGYFTDFVLWIDGSGRVLPIRALGVVPAPCVAVASKPDGSVAVATLTSDFQKFSPFTVLEEGAETQGQEGHVMGGATDPSSFLPPHIHAPRAAAASALPRLGANGTGPLDYGPYYVPAEYYSSLAKEHSLESQDSSTLSSPPSDGLAPPRAQEPTGGTAPDALFQFSIGKILEDEGVAGVPGGQETECELPAFYEGVTYSEGPAGADRGPASPLQIQPPDLPEAENTPADQRRIRRVIMSVNDKWHYCHNSEVLVGSRAMRDRHLRLLGYIILQLPYQELEKLNGIEEVKQYLHRKLLDVPL
ncbi:fas-activated serine/threonine kinase [Genypterus blacodes]|uniref:fas-activated serine/threonine kinase n=1 Tax=Genypterus blacodes TaxID=154954 RepID=UPI003F75A8BC